MIKQTLIAKVPTRNETYKDYLITILHKIQPLVSQPVDCGTISPRTSIDFQDQTEELCLL